MLRAHSRLLSALALLFSGIAVHPASLLAQGAGLGFTYCTHPSVSVWSPTTRCPNQVVIAQARHEGVTVGGYLFVPDAQPVDFAVVLVGGGLIGSTSFTSGSWRSLCVRFRCALLHVSPDADTPTQAIAQDPGRNAKLGGGPGLLALLDSLAEKSGHSELRTTKLALWGFSATGSFAITFAARYPERTIAAIRVHSHLRGLDVDTTSMLRTPVLMIVSTADSTAGTEDSRRLWAVGRQRGAPWALAIETNFEHVSLDSWWTSSELVWRWIEAQRPTSAPVGPQQRTGAWLGVAPNTIASLSAFRGDQRMASWFPDSVTAHAWKRFINPVSQR